MNELVGLQQRTDEKVIADWIARQRSPRTQEAYRRDVDQALEKIGKPIQAVTLPDLDKWLLSLEGKPATRARKVASVQSLFHYCLVIGYLVLNPSGALKAPKIPDTLAERIMTEEEAWAVIDEEPDPRNRALLWLLYESGLRVSELCGLRWECVIVRSSGAQISVLGKGGEQRQVLISRGVYNEICRLEDGDGKGKSGFVFQSRKTGGRLDTSQVWRLVAAAGKRVGLVGFSPHWFRHANATHALENGADLLTVKSSLGHGSERTTFRYLHARPNVGTSNYIRRRYVGEDSGLGTTG